jgi:hypothetical protein
VANLRTLIASSSSPQEGYRLELSGLGPDLSGRRLGERIRHEVLELGSDTIIFDCTGVDSMSPSFADEAFGKLAHEAQRPYIRVINASPDILSTVSFAVRERSSDRSLQPS